MPLTPKQLCENLAQVCPNNQGTQYYYNTVLAFLCNIANGAGYHHVLLCDPGTGLPVIVRYQFTAAGELSTEDTAITAFNIDGTEYTGDLEELLSCGGGGEGGESVLSQADFETVTEADYTTIGAAFASIYTNDDPLVYLLIINSTDTAVEFAFDGGSNVQLILQPAESRRYDFAQNRRRHSGGVSARYKTSAPTTGKIFIEAYA